MTTTPEAQQLAPCPFCGGNPTITELEPHTHAMSVQGFRMPDYGGGTAIECACGAGLIEDTNEDHRERVIARWNRRAQPPAPPVPAQPVRSEIEQLREEVKELDALRDKLADILSRTAIALRGPEPTLTRWSWHDLPERAAAAIATRSVPEVPVAPAGTHPNNAGFAVLGEVIRDALENQAVPSAMDACGHSPGQEAREPAAWTTYAHIDAMKFGKSGLFVKGPGTVFCVPVYFGAAQYFDDHRDPT